MHAFRCMNEGRSAHPGDQAQELGRLGQPGRHRATELPHRQVARQQQLLLVGLLALCGGRRGADGAARGALWLRKQPEGQEGGGGAGGRRGSRRALEQGSRSRCQRGLRPCTVEEAGWEDAGPREALLPVACCAGSCTSTRSVPQPRAHNRSVKGNTCNTANQLSAADCCPPPTCCAGSCTSTAVGATSPAHPTDASSGILAGPPTCCAGSCTSTEMSKPCQEEACAGGCGMRWCCSAGDAGGTGAAGRWDAAVGAHGGCCRSCSGASKPPSRQCSCACGRPHLSTEPAGSRSPPPPRALHYL